VYNGPGGWRFILPAALSRGRLECKTDPREPRHQSALPGRWYPRSAPRKYQSLAVGATGRVVGQRRAGRWHVFLAVNVFDTFDNTSQRRLPQQRRWRRAFIRLDLL